MRICVLNLYFGRAPDYFDLFLISCERNPNVDFVFFIDFDAPLNIPANVKFINTTFNDVVSLFQSNFNFKISLKLPYKISDFRPAIGEVFNEYLKGYDWWGHCDFDMVFGNLSPAVKLAEDSKHVKIFRQGHLTLFKNESSINQIYRNDFTKIAVEKIQVVDNVKEINPYDCLYMSFKEVFTSDKFYCFDEYWGIDRLFYILNLPVYRVRLMADINCRSAYIKSPAHKNYFGQYFIWRDGKLSRMSLFNDEKCIDEFIYIHMQKRKMKQHYDFVDKNSVILINQFGLFDEKKWLNCHFAFALFSCIPNISHLYRYYLPRIIKQLKLRIADIMSNKNN